MKKLLFLCAGVALLSSASFESAKALYDAGRYDEAWSELSTLVRADPANKELNILMLQTANKSGRENQALAVLERLADLEPNNAHFRKELIKSYANIGDKASAQHEMDMLRGVEPALVDSGFEYDINSRLNAAKENMLYSARIAFGVNYNSNVNSGLDSLGVRIGDMDLELNEKAKKKGAFGGYANANLNLAYKLSDSWWAVGDINAYGEGYGRDISQNKHYGWGRVAAGLRYTGENSLVDFRAKFEHSALHPNDKVNAPGGELTFLYNFNQNWQSIVKLSGERRDYRKRDEKTSNFYHAGAYLRYMWSASNWAMAGFRVLNNSKADEFYAYSGYEGILRFGYSPMSKLDILPFVSFKELRYKGASSTLGKRLGEDKRRDKVFSAGLNTQWHWSKNFASELGYSYIKNSSNSDLYDYNQHRVNFGLVFSF